MNALFCSALLLAAQLPTDFRDRERHPLAPSLPLLTKDESAAIEKVIDRFIEYDIGKLKGAEGRKALDDFNRLGSEATFELIDGLNRTANLEASCPVVIIAKKLASIFLTTEDTELLTFARENIGAGVTVKRHINVIKDLQTQCLLRRAAVQRRVAAQGGKKAVNVMTLAELEKAAAKESGVNLKAVIAEAEKRAGPKAIGILLAGIAHSDADTAKLSQGLLTKHLQRQSPEALKTMLKHDRKEVRIAAAETVGARKLRLGNELIVLLTASDDEECQAGRRALVQIAGGLDFGPSANVSIGEREEAITRWRDWWRKQK